MDFVKEAVLQNEHWEKGKIELKRMEGEFIPRDVLPEFEKEMDKKFIVIIRGLRRTGKSVLTRFLLQKAIENGKDPKKIAWFEFDRSMGAKAEDLDSLLRFFKGRDAKIIALDEIPFVSGWQDVLKRHYDLSDIKFIVTGSSALEMDRRSSESLMGRFALIKIKRFSFREYLLLKGKKVPNTERELASFSEEMGLLCDEYIHSGGLPEAIKLTESDRKEYIKNSILEPLFYKDLPAVLPSANPDLFLKVFELLAAAIGREFQLQSIAQILGVTHPTVSSCIAALERGLLTKQIFNYSGSLMKQKRTAKKAWFADNGMVSALVPEAPSGVLAENTVAQSIDASNFWRDSEGREVDFIIPEKKLTLEVKYQNQIGSSDEKNLEYFLSAHKDWKGILITKNENEKKENEKIKRIPLWKWLLSQS